MNDRIQLKNSRPSKGFNPSLKADILSEYAPVRQFANSTLRQAAQLLTTSIGAKVAAVCWVSSNSVRLMATHGMGSDRLARSLPKDFTWFAPAETMFSSDTAVLSQIQAFLGLSNYGFLVSVPLWSHSGHVMGSVLILDTQPLTLSPLQLELLCGIADLAMDSINTALTTFSQVKSVSPVPSVTTQFRLEAAIDQAKESVIAFDLQGHISFWNDGAESMYGYSSQKMLGQPITLIIPALDQIAFLRFIKDLERKPIAPHLVTRLHQSGFRVQVRSSLQVIRNETGVVIGILEFSGLSADPARAATIERFQSLVQHLPMLFLQTDAKGILTFIEGNILNDYRRSSDDLMGLAVKDIFLEQPEIQMVFLKALSGQTIHTTVSWRNNQYETWVVPLLHNGKIIGCNVLAVDITSQLETKQQLLATRNELELLIGQLPLLLVKTDLTGTITSIHGGALHQVRNENELGAHRVQIGSSVADDLIEVPAALQMFQEAARGQTSNGLVHWRDRVFDAWVKPMLEDGQQKGTIAIALDVTARNKSEQSLLEASKRIEQLLETLPILAVAVDTKGCITLLEGQGVRHFGGEENAQKLMGLSLGQVLDDPIIENLIESALEGEEFSVSFDFKGLTLEVFVRPIFENNVFVGANAIVLDISDSNRAMLEKRLALQELLTTQTALAQQQAFAQMVLETIEQGVTVNNVSGLLEYVSPVYARMLGYESEELIGVSLTDLVVNKAEVQIALQERNEGWTNTNRYQAIRKDGSLVWIEVTGYARHNRHGEIIGGGIGIIRDISLEVDYATEMATMQAKLLAEQEFANQVASTITQGVVTIDANGLVIYANQAVANMVQCSLEALIGTEAILLAPEAERPQILQSQWRQIIKGEIRTYQHNMIRQDGQVRQVEVTVHPNLDLDQRFTGSVMFVTDITDKQNLETSLERERDYALSIARSLQAGLVVTDTELNFEYVNPAFTALFGYTLEDLRGKNPHEIIHPEDHTLLEQAMQDRRLGQHSSYRYRMFHKNGEVVHIQGSGYPRTNPQGQLIGTIATMDDITQELALEQAVQQARRAMDRESRNVLLVANAISDGLLFMSQEGLVEYANPGVLKMLGYDSRKQVIGLPAFTWVIPEDLALLKQETKRIRNGEIRSYQLRLKRDNNKIITIEGTSYPRLEQGNFVGSIVVLRDMSQELEQQQRQEQFTQALLQSEHQFRALFEQSLEQTKRLELIDTIRNAASPANTTTQLIQDIVSSISQTLSVPMVSIYFHEQDKLVLQHAVGYEKTMKFHRMDGRGVMVRSAKNNQVMLITDASTDPDFVHLSGKIQSELCVPITNQNQVLGVINLESTEKNAFGQADANLLLQIAERISDKIQMTHILDELRALEQKRYAQ